MVFKRQTSLTSVHTNFHLFRHFFRNVLDKLKLPKRAKIFGHRSPSNVKNEVGLPITDSRKAASVSLMPISMVRSVTYTKGTNRPINPNTSLSKAMMKMGSYNDIKWAQSKFVTSEIIQKNWQKNPYWHNGQYCKRSIEFFTIAQSLHNTRMWILSTLFCLYYLKLKRPLKSTTMKSNSLNQLISNFTLLVPYVANNEGNYTFITIQCWQ